MNTPSQLTYPTTFLDRIAYFLARAQARTRALRTIRLEDISYRLMVKATTLPTTATAKELQPILEQAAKLPASEWALLAGEGEGRRVLVDNEYLKVVLIRWATGVACERHYHPNGGGVLMVLDGAISESRFLNATVPAPYETREHERHGISYIDDTLGAHVVANPHEHAAVTLHAYLKYRRG